MKIIPHLTAKQMLDLLYNLLLMNEIKMKDPIVFFLVFDDLVNKNHYIYDLRIKMFKIRKIGGIKWENKY